MPPEYRRCPEQRGHLGSAPKCIASALDKAKKKNKENV